MPSPEKYAEENKVIMDHLSYDVLVIGSGGAGLRAAIAAAGRGLKVGVISRGKAGKATCTMLSAGVFAGSDPEGPPDEHYENTLISGRGINRKELVRALVDDAPVRLRELVRWGVKGEFRGGYLFCHGRAPVWGGEITRVLVAVNQDLGTEFLEGLVAVRMVAVEGAIGVLACSAASDHRVTVSARAMVLAMGGGAAVYSRHDNPDRMLGDGYQLAFECGAVLEDMEFVQFYPLGLAEAGCPPFLIPPRVGEVGKLVNDRGESILEKYGITERPAAEKARDKLSRALFEEMEQKGRAVFLDLRELTGEKWPEDPFSASCREILVGRYGALERPLRVAPMAHHCMGGVVIDPNGATSVPGCFAAGEVAGGLHGANRMGGNALSETLVFGARAGTGAADWASGSTAPKEAKIIQALGSLPERPGRLETGLSFSRILGRLRDIMWRNGGIVRRDTELSSAIAQVDAIQEEIQELSRLGGRRDIPRLTGLRSAAFTASLVLQGAKRRQESRGAHFREDFPDQDDEKFLGHWQVRQSESGIPVWNFEHTRVN